MADVSDIQPVAIYDDRLEPNALVRDIRVEGALSELASHHAQGRFDAAVMAIGYKHLVFRMKVFSELTADQVPFATLIHPSAFVHGSARVNPGAILFPRCVVDAGVEIGPNTLLNTGCIVAHDSFVGEGTFMGPGVTVAGFVRIGRGCFVGVGTVIRDGVVLGDGCSTGAGAVVIKDVVPGDLVLGVPARPCNPPQ
jgi:sugar O-acyltransferase (sialic acid O-acetyltransferase NeuD family)